MPAHILTSGGSALPSVSFAAAALNASATNGSAAGQASVSGGYGGSWSMTTTAPLAINAGTGALTTTGALVQGSYSATLTYTFGSNGETYTVSETVSIAVAAAPVVAPTVTTAPSLSTSSPVVGSAITPTRGVYTGSPAVTAQWFYADTGALISGAPTTSGTAYTPVSADLGHPLKYIETATNSVSSVASAAPTTAAVVAAAASVLPSTSWRVTATAVSITGSTADSTNQAALLASPSNNDLPIVQTAANAACVVVWTLPAIASVSYHAKGAALFLTTSNGSPAARTLKLEYAPDGVTYSDITPTPMTTYSSQGVNADQLLEVPAGSAGATLRLTYTATAAHSFRVQLHQFQSDVRRNGYVAVDGMSITQQNCTGGLIRDQLTSTGLAGAADLVFISTARAGAQPSTMLSEQLNALWLPRTYVYYHLIDWGPNQELGALDTYAQVAAGTSSDGTTVTSALSDTQATLDWATNNARALFPLAASFCDIHNDGIHNYPSNIFVDQPAVTESGQGVSVSNQNNGMRAWNQNIYVPKMAANAKCFDTTTKLPKYDAHSAMLLAWDTCECILQYTRQDGIHPVGLGGPIYRSSFVDAALSEILQTARTHVLLRRIQDYTLTGASTAVINRLWLVLNSLIDTMDATTRSNWSSMIAAIPTTYQEVSGQTAPTALPNIVASFDFDDPLQMFNSDAATVGARDWELVHIVNNKASSGSKLVQAASTSAAGSYSQPQCRNNRINGRGGLVFDGTYANMTCTDAAVVGALNAAAQPFIIGWTEQVLPGGAKQSWYIATSTPTTVFQARSNSGGATSMQIVGQSAVIGTESSAPVQGSVAVYVLAYDGMTLTLRRNGVQVFSVAYIKPAWTGATLKLGVGATAKLGWHMIAGAWTQATLSALENRMRAKAGV